MNRWSGRTECGGHLGEIIRITGEDVVSQPESQVDEMTVYDIRRAGQTQEPTDRRAVIKRMHRDRLEKRGQTSLPRTVSPHLGHYWMGRMQPCTRSSDSGEEGAGGFIPAVDRDQHPGVKDHSP